MEHIEILKEMKQPQRKKNQKKNPNQLQCVFVYAYTFNPF